MENVLRRTVINRNTDGSYEAKVTYRVTAAVTNTFKTPEEAQKWAKNFSEPQWSQVVFPNKNWSFE